MRDIHPIDQELAARARLRRERIRQKIKKLDQLSVSFSEDDPRPISVFQLSNPTFDTTLPFPFVGFVLPRIFELIGGNEEDWFYMGREKFAELRDKFEHICNDPTRTTLIVYGTEGYGKSHLLAALVCYLAAKEVKVVYVPNCWSLWSNPELYIRAAMLFAWADDERKQQIIMRLDTLEEIGEFLEMQSEVVFVIDQLEALEKERYDTEYTVNRKIKLREWLQGLVARGKGILISSANYQSVLNRASRSDTEIMYVYGGLTRKEMDQWWARRQEVELGDYTKAEVEDFTGCIPMFLENCVVDRKINLATEFFRDIQSQVMLYEWNIRSDCRASNEKLRRHYEYMKACVFGLPVSTSWKHIGDLDHRYFYEEYDPTLQEYVGRYTCGMCRNTVAEVLLDLWPLSKYITGIGTTN